MRNGVAREVERGVPMILVMIMKILRKRKTRRRTAKLSSKKVKTLTTRSLSFATKATTSTCHRDMFPTLTLMRAAPRSASTMLAVLC